MKPSTRWPLGIALVLGVTVTANLVLYYVAGADPSFAIEPNYYAKALAWDSTLAQDKHNAALGWRLAPALTAFAPGSGARLSVTITDSTGTPITDAVVKVAALYNARAGTVLESTLGADAQGYSTTLGIAHAGQWELRFSVTRGRERFTSSARIDAVRAGSGT